MKSHRYSFRSHDQYGTVRISAREQRLQPTCDEAERVRPAGYARVTRYTRVPAVRSELSIVVSRGVYSSKPRGVPINTRWALGPVADRCLSAPGGLLNG